MAGLIIEGIQTVVIGQRMTDRAGGRFEVIGVARTEPSEAELSDSRVTRRHRCQGLFDDMLHIATKVRLVVARDRRMVQPRARKRGRVSLRMLRTARNTVSLNTPNAPSTCAEWAAASPTGPAPATYTVDPVVTPAEKTPW